MNPTLTERHHCPYTLDGGLVDSHLREIVAVSVRLLACGCALAQPHRFTVRDKRVVFGPVEVPSEPVVTRADAYDQIAATALGVSLLLHDDEVPF